MNEEERAIEERFASLEEASRSLDANVVTLNDTLVVIGELTRKQREQAERQAATEAALRENKEETDARDVRTRRVISMVALTMGILLPVVSILVYLTLLSHVNDLLAQQRASTFQSCQIRNMATIENADREQTLGNLETNKELKTIHVESAQKLRAALINCDRYLKPPGKHS